MGVEVMVVAAGVQMYGQYQANKAQAKAERANAAYLEEQKQMALREKRRAVDIYTSESDQFIGQKVSTIAKSGIDMSGTMLMALAGDKARISREKDAIATSADATARIAGLRKNAALETANTLSSFNYNFIQGAGTGLNAAAQIGQMNAAKGKDFFGNPLKSKSTVDVGMSSPLLKEI